jgi:hypothetical protein
MTSCKNIATVPSSSQPCQPRHFLARFAFSCECVKNSANCAKMWRDFREIWRSPEPKLASKVLAHGAQNR